MNILQLDKAPPYPPSNGAEKRTWRTAEKLAEFGNLWLACPWRDAPSLPDSVVPVPIRTRTLRWQSLSNDLWYGGFLLDDQHPIQRLQTAAIGRQLTATEVTFDLVVSEAPQTSAPARRIARHHDATLLLNKHNSYFDFLEQYLAQRHLPATVRRRAVANLRRYEQDAIDQADIVVFQSERDRELFDLPARVSTAVIPNGTDYEAIQAGGDPARLAATLGLREEAFVCVFVGSFDYDPNRAAARVISDELAPQLPDMEFVFVGRNPPGVSLPNVSAPGFVDQLGDALDLADVALCPLPRGSGTKLKMLDYMAAALPIVTTPVGTQGLPITDGEHALVRDDAPAMVAALRELAESPALRTRLGANAHALSQQYAWSALMDEYDPLLEDACPRAEPS